MYPLILSAPIKDYLWGGRRLIDEYKFTADGDIAAEAWLLSCHKDGTNIIKNGSLKGETLTNVIEMWGKKALGANCDNFSYFPLLIKLIDARDRLSLQVHPDDEYALRVEGEFGKTEMWYVVDCDEGAELIYGLTSEITKEEFEKRIADNTIEQFCNKVPVSKGDVFFISSGTLHAIGKGILIAEVQQNSNSTYRVSDYGRRGADGKLRELHIEKAVDVTLLNKPTLPYGKVGNITEFDNFTQRELSRCNLFSVDLIKLNGEAEFGREDSFVSVVVLNGECSYSFGGEETILKKGSSIFLPAGIKININGNAEILKSWV